MLKILALLGLGLGPVIAVTLKHHRQALLALDAFVVLTITGLVFGDILPQSLQAGGLYALVAMALGAFLPTLLHGSTDTCHHQERTPILLGLSWLALACHALMDGLGISCGSHHDHHHHLHHGASLHMPIAMILHRTIEGMGLWWLFRTHLGLLRTIAVLCALGATTGMGMWIGEHLHAHAAPLWLIYLQAGLAGSLLHVLFRHGPPQPISTTTPSSPTTHRASLLGVGCAIVALLLLFTSHEHTHPVFAPAITRWMLIQKTIIATIGAWFMAGIIHIWLPSPDQQSPFRRPTLLPAHGAWMGLIAGDCICGNMRLFRQWLARKLPGRAAITFLTATATIGLPTWLITSSCFDLRTGWYRCLVGLFGSMLIGLLLGDQIDTTGSTPPSSPQELTTASTRNRWLDGLTYLRDDLIPQQLPWLLVGLCGADLLLTTMTPDAVRWISQAFWSKTLLVGLCLPLYISPICITPIAYVLWLKGLPLGSLLAMFWFSSATSMSQYNFLSRHFGQPLALRHTIYVITWGLGCMLLETIWPSTFASTIGSMPNSTIYDTIIEISWMGWPILVLFALIVVQYVASVPLRSLFNPVMLPNTQDNRLHHHHHHHHHIASSHLQNE